MKLKFILLLLPTILFSQIKKYGDVSMEEFKSHEYKDADAYVIFKYRESTLEYQNASGWTLVTTVHERIKINSKEGNNYATKNINYYIANSKNDELINIKAVTYNVKDEKITKTKLKSTDIFNVVINDKWAERKFTMPNVNENSIVEWKYTIRSNYFYIINDVVFQYDIPIKYFKAKISIIDHLKFKYWFTNRLDAIVNTKNGLEVEVKNVPALKKEPYVKNINLYRAKIIFDVFATDFPGNGHKDYSKTWKNVVKSIYEDDRFGKQLRKSSYYKSEFPLILAKSKTKKDSILSIYNFVKNKLTWNKIHGKFTRKGVKKALSEGNGNTAEINLMLTSMLRKIGFKANPILLSTRDHIVPYFPTISGFNYVICGVEMDEDILLLDATEKYGYIDVLPLKTINGLGRMIRKNGSSTFIDLLPKNIPLTKKNINININENASISGNFRFLTTGTKALINRKKLNDINNDDLISYYESKYKNIEIEKIRLLNKDKPEKSFVVSAKFDGTNKVETINDKLFINPLFFLQKTETVFKSETRKYPIDFGIPYKDVTHISITIPKNYKILSKPENVIYTFENKQGLFSYSIKEENNKITIKVVEVLSNPIIKVEKYADFKELILKIIQKENEKIVLIKS